MRHSWEIAVALRDIAERRADLPSDGVGPISAPVVAAQRRAVSIAEGAIEARVSALERYEAQVARADAARRDWSVAQKAASQNDRYRDLVARTAGDERATADLSGLAAAAGTAAQALQEALASAACAAEVLAL